MLGHRIVELVTLFIVKATIVVHRDDLTLFLLVERAMGLKLDESFLIEL